MNPLHGLSEFEIGLIVLIVLAFLYFGNKLFLSPAARYIRRLSRYNGKRRAR